MAGHVAEHTLSDEPSAMPSSFGVHAMQCSVFSVLSTVIPSSVHIIPLGSPHGAEDSSGMRS